MVEIITNILVYFLNITEYMTFFYVIFGKRKKQKIEKVFLIIVNLLFICFIGVKAYMGLTFLLALIASLICVIVIYDASRKELISLFFIAFPLISILENAIQYVCDYIFNRNESIVSITYLIFIISMLWIYYLLQGRKLDRDAFILPFKTNIIMSLLLFIIIAMYSYFTFALTEVLHLKRGILGMALVEISGIVIFFVFLYMIYNFNVQRKYQMENELLERYNEQQKRYFELLLEKEQKTRQFRHDITNELIQIKNFANKERYKELQEYVTETLDDISFINRYNYDVGNEIINVILNYYLEPIKEQCKIEVEGFLPEETKISDRDLSIMVSNLITNAVEAVEKVKPEEKYISFHIKEAKLFTFITVKNTYVGERIGNMGGTLKSSKMDDRSHGFGLKNIKNIVERNDGEMVCRTENNQFIVEIRIKN